MFDELYKKSMDDVKPDDLLIQKTKNLMHKELKKKPKTFYKYVAAVACFIITFSLFRISFDTASNVNIQDTSIGDVGNLDKDVTFDAAAPDTFPNSNNFISAGSSEEVKGYFSNTSYSSNDNVFIRIIKTIVAWFQDLFS